MKAKRMYELGSEWFRGLSLYTIDRNGRIGSYTDNRNQLTESDLKSLAVVVPYTTADSGYGATTVDRSNYECFPQCRHCVTKHSQIFVRLTCNCERTQETISALESYPLIDEYHHSKLEWDEKQEAWDSFGYDTLKECLKEHLFLESIESYNQDEVRSAVESSYDLMLEQSDGSFYVSSRDINPKLEKLDRLWLWSQLLEVTISEEEFKDLSHEIYHAARHVKFTDADTGEKLEIPWFIFQKYSETQVKVPGTENM